MSHTWAIVYMSVHLSGDRVCQRDSVTTIEDAVLKFHRREVEIRLKAEFKDGGGLTYEYSSIPVAMTIEY